MLGLTCEPILVWEFELPNYLFVAVTNYLTKISLRRDGFIRAHSWRVQCLTVGKSWGQGLEAAGHIVSVRKQGEIGTADKDLFIQSGAPAGSRAAHSQGGPFYLN